MTPNGWQELGWSYLELLGSMAIQYVPRVLLALITLWVGFFIVRMIVRAMDRAFGYQRLDRTLAGFLKSFVGIVLKILIVVSVANMIGVQMASFIALIGAAGLAIGLSLQGSLGNLAGGLLILTFKPFKIGDDIEAQGQRGEVTHIEIFSTILKRGEGIAIIPNGVLSNGVIVNHSRNAHLSQ